MKNVEDILPLSPMQQLMLMHSVTVAGSSALSNQFRYRITGPLDVGRFSAAWQQLVDRHAALRTGFAWQDLREPVQVVREFATLPFQYADLSECTASERAAQLTDLHEADRQLGFDLRKAPLLRVVVIRLSADEHIMLWTRHHLVLDRWCVDILFDELFGHYDRQGAEDAPALPPAGTFRRYVEWLQRQDAAGAETYWREALAGLARPSLIAAPSATRGRDQGHALSSLHAVLDDALYARLEALARSCRISQAALLQGAVALLLARHCRQRDVMFGMTVSGRPADLDGVESIMGSFINNVPVRQRLDDTVPLSDWLRSLHAAQAARSRYEYVSPTDLHRWSGLPASTPLFDLLLLMHSPATEVRTAERMRIEQLDGPLDSAFPLTLALAANAGRLEVTLVFDAGRVERTLADALLDDLQDILGQMSRQPDSALGVFLPAIAEAVPGIAVAAEDPTTRARPDAGATADAQTALKEIWQTTLGLQTVGLDDDFFALGGTSVQAALLFTQIEKRFGKVLPLSTLFTAGSVREFLGLLDQPVARTSPLVAIQPLGGRTPIFAVPGIGGNVVGLAGLARALGPGQPLFGLQSAGLDGQDDPDASIEDIAARYLKELPRGGGPIVLLGICWGAAVAFEMAQRLTASGHPPALLVVMDPVYDEAMTSAAPARASRSGYMLRFVGDRLRLYAQEFRAGKGAERRAWLRDKLGLVISMIRHRDPFRGDRSEFNRRRVSVANLTALMRYRPAPYPGAVLVLLTGEREVDPATDPRRQWLQFVQPASRQVQIPGRDTGDALSARRVAALAAILRREFAEHSNERRPAANDQAQAG